MRKITLLLPVVTLAGIILSGCNTYYDAPYASSSGSPSRRASGYPPGHDLNPGASHSSHEDDQNPLKGYS